MTTPAPLKERVRAAVQATASPTRAELHTRQRRLLLGVGGLLLGTALFNGLDVIAHKPLLYVLIVLLAMGGVALLTSRGLARLGTTVAIPRESRFTRSNRLVLPLLVLGTVLANLAAPETLHAAHPAHPYHYGCMALGLLVGALIAAAGVFALRGADPIAPRKTACAVGAAAGAWTCLALTIKCSLMDPVHVLTTHVAPVALLMVVTMWLGTRRIGLVQAKSARRT